MSKYPKHIRDIQEQFGIPDDGVIEVKVGAGEPRVCDYCNTLLIDEKGTAVQTAYLTDYGLICGGCIGSTKPLTAYQEGRSVFYEDWYQDGIDKE